MDDNCDNGTEKLFLLEFLVDYVTIQRTESMMKGMDNDQCVWFRSPTCVAFQFLNYPPLEICQDDFSTMKCAQDGKSMFKNGKSCLFAIPGTQLCQPSPTFAVDVAVHKKLPPECLPGQVLVGNATIQLGDLFNGLVQLIKNTPECVPVSKTLKDGFVLTNQSGNAVGEIKVFIRLSCFGKLIVTQFELGGGNKPFLFKGSEGSGVYECQKVDSHDKCGVQSPMQPDMRSYQPQNLYLPSQPCPPCAPPPPCPPCPSCQPSPPCSPVQPYAQYQTSSPRPSGPPCPPCAISPDRPWSDVFGYGDKNMNQAPVCSPSVCEDKDKYEEIGAEVNGHALKIRVPKRKKKKSTCGPCAPCAAPPTDPCGPCAPCTDTTGATQMLPPPPPPCGSCAPCENPPNYGAHSSAMDACAPCAPCGNPPVYGNSYGAQSSPMDACGPCSPCGNPPSYGGQNSTMDACGPCGIPSNYGNSYGAQNMTMDACGPCAPCGSPSPYGNYGTQNMATDSCAPCLPNASQGTAAKGMTCGMCGPSFGGQNSAGEPCSSCPACIQSNQQNQLIFNHPCSPGKVPESSVFYKVTACPEECTPGAGGGCKKTIKIEPQIQCGGNAQDQQQDSARDVFVLRIGKKGDGPDHKSNLELELRTPKCPLGPSSQAPEAAASKPPEDKKKGGKKDKGKGKGKGKKGKKKK